MLILMNANLLSVNHLIVKAPSIDHRWIDIRADDQKELGRYSFMLLIEESGKIR